MGRLVKNPQLAPNAGVAGSGQMPAGTTAERPDVTNDGQMRYNTSNSAMEYTTDGGSTWQQVGATGLATITKDSFTGDAIQTVFVMSIAVASSSEVDVIVIIGGVFQNPGVSYTTDGSTNLTFTSAPPNNESIIVLHGYNEVV